LPGVEEVNVSLAHEEIFVRYDKSVTSRREIENLIERLGFRLAYRGRGLYEEALRAEKARLLRSLALTAIVGALMLYMKLYSPSNAIALIVGALASANLFILGRRYLSMAMSALRRGILNQHVLMSATALSGLAGGTLGLLISPETFPPGEFYGVTSFVTTYHILGGYAAGYARKRASDAIERLKSLQPSIARVIEGGGLVEKPVEDVKRGDLILVKPGERIPLDGVVVEGETSVDESIVTGESTPVDKRPGDRVVAGSINVVGAIVVRVARPSSESFIARIARHMEEMRGLKPPILQLLDRVLGVYVPLVLSVALTALSYWIIAPWLLGGSPDVSRASFAFLTVLVMGYPCALGMSVPLSMIRGGQFAALKGILFRGVEPIHILAGRGVIFFDKTGTLTEGRPSVEHVEALEGYSEEDVLRASACLEVFSNHPLARSIVDKAYESHGGIECGEVRGVKEYRGLGIEGFINGARVAVGRLEFLEDKGFTAPAGLEATVDRLHSLGLTLVFVGINGRIAGLIGVSDKVKEGASQAIEELKRLGFRVGMLTGDSERVAARIAEILGIDTYKAGLLPEEKTRIIRELQRRGERVIMVGDGINDAPSLTVADVGIALGTGADITVEAADVVITGGNPYKVVESVKISRYMYNHTKQNLGIAFSLNGIGVPVAATGLLQPYWAMIAMIASVSLILANTFLRKIG
nr:cation-translocating P-type ATPase [Desulfurococcales archaeon]